ncbi:hypothetical protein HUT03_01460 [Candidatus Liberibacter africanus]|nr:hypothetical protein HUT03_01460 [Candidatus Liberibacter africanus]
MRHVWNQLQILIFFNRRYNKIFAKRYAQCFFCDFQKKQHNIIQPELQKKIILKKKSIKKEQLSDLNPQNNKKDKNRSKNASPIKRKENIVSSSKPNPNHNDFDK